MNRAHVDGFLDLVRSTGWQVYYVDVPERPTLPYVLVWSPPGGAGSETALDAAERDYDTRFGVTMTAGTALGVVTVADRVRATLTPGGLPGTFPVPGRSGVDVRRVDSQPVQKDADHTRTDTDKPLYYAVDLYRVRSTPA